MTTLRTVFRLSVAIALVGALLWVLRRHPPVTAADASLLPGLRADSIVDLSIATATWACELRRTEGQWLIVRPIQARADAAVVERLLAALEDLSSRERIGAADRRTRELTLGDFGLASPRMKLRAGSGQQAWRLSVGGPSPLGDGVYVAAQDADDVVATTAALLDVLPAGLPDLRSRTVFALAAADIQRLDIERSAGGFLRLVREEHGWAVRQPLSARAEAARVEGLLGKLLALRALNFVWDPPVGATAGPAGADALPAAYGLAAPSLAVTAFGRADPQGIRLSIGNAFGGSNEFRYARIQGADSVFAVAATAIDDVLTLSLKDVRDPVLFAPDPRKVTAVRLAEGEYKLALDRRADGAWQITAPVQWQADDDLVDRFVQRTLSLRASAQFEVPMTNAAALGLEPPALVIELGRDRRPAAAGSPAPEAAGPDYDVERLRIGGPAQGPDTRVAMIDGESTVRAIPAAALDALFPAPLRVGAQRYTHPLAFRNRVMLALDPHAVRAISLRRTALEQSVERGADRAWRAVKPTDGRIVKAALENLLIAAAQLRALRIEAMDPPDLAGYGLADSETALTFGLEEGEGLQKRLILGFRSRTDGVFAMVQGQDLVFVLDARLVESMLGDIVVPPPAAPAPAGGGS